MLDIKFIREHADEVKNALVKKHVKLDLDRLLALDEQRLSLLRETETLRATQNSANEEIAKAPAAQKKQLIASMKEVASKVDTLKEQSAALDEEYQDLLWRVPQIPDASVPDGKSDADNLEIKAWGQKPTFSFDPKDHAELMTALGMVDFERGAKVHGFRGYFLTGDAVRLCFAIWSFALEFFAKKGFVPVMAPAIVRKELLYGTGHLPGDIEDFYMTQDGDALAGTAEVPLMGFYKDETITFENGPKMYLGFSPCYRREAGAHGKDVKGLIRVHEFFKFEQLILCEASHELSVKLHDQINRNTEEFIEMLGIPYHTVVNCGGDLGLGQVKKYDIELWVPKQQTYREISSASYFHDFQCRRSNIRYRDPAGKLQYAHSLNSTAIPTPRILVSLVENYQQADGSIAIPKALQPYMGGMTEIKAKE